MVEGCTADRDAQLVAVGEIVRGFEPWWVVLPKEDLSFRSSSALLKASTAIALNQH
jgi:hypothetical protein